MAISYTVDVDCTDPHRLATFWAVALDYVLEDNAVLIQRLLDAGAVTEDDVTTVDGRLFFRSAAAIRDPEDPVNPDTGMGLGHRMLFQAIPAPDSAEARDDVDATHLSAPKISKNRLHLDLRVGAERRDAHVAKLKELGATYLWEGSQGPSTWVTMADPEGNEFCVV